ncbi:DUF7662 domain-containing protein [Amycolatopsis palatopharyngis]|uniref:DUF7662 domain-containing protein n=1 Tax=Amycolatopsis palatopharyngis TaxID=187982 RepID=UPI000E23348E|nr:hypothetical protein [Amycolatopsis palatopharyngis]
MGKYDPLRDHLAARRDDVAEMRMTFTEIEQLVGALPAEARSHRAWWANDSKIEARAWRAAGWHVEMVDQAGEQVVFSRGVLGAIGYAEPVRPAPDAWLSGAQVRAIVVRYLTTAGWTILRAADEVLASRTGRTLAVQVVGSPGPAATPARVRHGYAAALLGAMRSREAAESGELDTALALPDSVAYRDLVDSTLSSLSDLGVSVLFVRADGHVDIAVGRHPAGSAPLR